MMDGEQWHAVEAVMLAAKPGVPVVVSGAAGTGKSRLIEGLAACLVTYAGVSSDDGSLVVTAATNLATLNIGGQHGTLQALLGVGLMRHSWEDYRDMVDGTGDFGAGAVRNNRKKQYLVALARKGRSNARRLRWLVVDEGLMPDLKFWKTVDMVMRVYRNEMNVPFGGVKLVIVGDPFQLPPWDPPYVMQACLGVWMWLLQG